MKLNSFIQNAVYAFLSIVLLSCQGQKNMLRAVFTPNKIVFQSLTAIDLSEDMIALSSKNDEIVLRVDILLEQAPWYKNAVCQKILVDSLNYPHRIIPNIITSTQQNIIVSLTELDNETAFAVHTIFDSLLIQHRILNISEHQLDSLLGYDDLLGLQILDGKKGFRQKKQKLVFRGRQFMDTYHYEIDFWVE